MATTTIKDGFQGGSDNQLKVNADGSINVTGGGGGSSDVNLIAVAGTPIALGQTTESASLPVTIASDQTPIPVSGTFFQSVQPVSATSLPLPTGAATSSLQTTGNTSLNSIDSKTPSLGQALAASSVPVVLTSSQLTTLTPLSSVTVTQTTGTNLHAVVDSGNISVSNFPATQPISGTVTVVQSSGSSLHVDIDNFPSTTAVTQSTSPWVVSGTVTANAGTNLNTSALALDSTVAKDSSLTTINTSINTLLKPSSTLSAVTTLGSITSALPAGTNTLGAVNQGTGGLSAWKVDGSAVTQPVSGTVNTKTPLTPSAPTFGTAGVASSLALAANPNRKGVVFVNTSTTATVSFGLGAAAVLNSGITLTPYGVWVMDEFTFTTGAINFIASAASTNVSIQELTT